MLSHLVCYFQPWHREVIALCIKQSPSNEAAMDTDNIMLYKTGRLVTRPETEKRRKLERPKDYKLRHM
jgi:hypothetical protein